MIATSPHAATRAPDRDAGPDRRRLCLAKRLYAERRTREQVFGELARVFRDPAWDIALDLFVAAEEGRFVSASSASIASRTPMTTGLRCVDRMVEAGVIVRCNDPVDARRSFVALTAQATQMMRRYLDGIGLAPAACTATHALPPGLASRRSDERISDAATSTPLDNHVADRL